jgi:hypothetical protein
MVETVRKQTIRIELTPEQKEQVQRAIGKEVPALQLTPEELEERAAPRLGIVSPMD